MASSPAVSDDSDAAAASDPIAVAPTIQSQTAIPAVHEEVSSRSAGTKRRRRHLRPAAAGAAVPPVVPAAAAAADAQAELQQARSQMAQVLAAIVALRAEMASFRNHVDARRMEMLAAIAAINDLCRLLRFLHGGSTK